MASPQFAIVVTISRSTTVDSKRQRLGAVDHRSCR
jgi:hypothetical protein